MRVFEADWATEMPSVDRSVSEPIAVNEPPAASPHEEEVPEVDQTVTSSVSETGVATSVQDTLNNIVNQAFQLWTNRA